MLDGFLASANRRKNERFIGVMTGNHWTNQLLKWKYRHCSSCSLLPTLRMKWSRYVEIAQVFFQQTSVWLDPVHTIHLYNTILEKKRDGAGKLILWVTNPSIIANPTCGYQNQTMK